MPPAFRVERDPLGDVRVPAKAYYGGQTTRAVENFPISGLTAPPALVTATVLVKKAAAEANRTLGRLSPGVARAIVKAADEILGGQFRDQFVVDVYQAGAGTSHNMNANEVLANRAAEILGERRGTYARVHPNDHVNMGQSTNDVYPTATRLAILFVMRDLLTSARGLSQELKQKSREFATVLKTGRTHLQDAVPITLGQEFGGYAANVAHAAAELERAAEQLHELNLGATAVGTGLNAGDDYTRAAIANLRRYTRLPLRAATNRFRVTQSMGDVLAYSGALRRLAVEVGKIASDLRLLSMGPRAGIAEIQLPAVQPGSSIMPGKVNPSVPEMVNQVCYQVIGLRRGDPGRGRRRTTRAERDDAGHRLERAPRHGHPRTGDARARREVRPRHRGRRGARPRTARPQHRAGDRAQPAHRLRADGRDREALGRDRPPHPRPRARASAAAGRRRSTRSFLRSR